MKFQGKRFALDSKKEDGKFAIERPGGKQFLATHNF